MTFSKMLRVLCLAGLLLPAGIAIADGGSSHGSWHHHERNSEDNKGKDKGKGGGIFRHLPEFDPSAAGAVAALLAGGGLLLVRRRSTR